MRNVNVKMIICIVFVLIGLFGCGGSSNTVPVATTAIGKFVDAPVEGLRYVSGGHSGFTGANGEFVYEVGQPVSFSVGGVTIGQAIGASIITPIDLVKSVNPGSNVTTNTQAVIQIAQFLLTASSLTSTGIRIDSTVIAACASQNINISTSNSSSFNSMINQVAATAGNRIVTSALDAQNHLISSMSGLASNSLVLPTVSSLGGGYSTIVGVWRRVNTQGGFNYLILFADNTFVYAENDLSAPATDNGVEVGTYTSNGTNITFKVLFDRNGPGYNSGIGELNTPISYDYALSNNGYTFTGANGQLVLDRVTFDSTDIVGVWRRGNAQGEFNYLILFTDNTFVYAENDLNVTFPENGVEVGTFTNNGTSITFNVIFDQNDPGNNSGIGDPNSPIEYSYILSNNGNTFDFIADHPFTLTRAF